ncbi:hypothetical protein NDU88_004561 [Pleurodeles waltl]|uniref:Uncharacterized protein n=1 Tax=Pleurodeles waltl TaxID=8319 RepID=A0AAV7T7Y8_PLEWA|nr:hypothetical protein NDU88_004561 [Pleurodeles waltl]
MRGLLKPGKTRNGGHRHRRRNKQRWTSRTTDRAVRRQQNAEADHALGRAWLNQQRGEAASSLRTSDADEALPADGARGSQAKETRRGRALRRTPSEATGRRRER